MQFTVSHLALPQLQYAYSGLGGTQSIHRGREPTGVSSAPVHALANYYYSPIYYYYYYYFYYYYYYYYYYFNQRHNTKL